MLAVIQGREQDRVPFVQYSGLAAPNEEIWSVIGRENMGLLKWSQAYRLEHPNCRGEHAETLRDGMRYTVSTLHTPAGDLTEERQYEPGYGSSAIRKHYIKDPQDYAAFVSFLKNTVVVEDTAQLLKDIKELGEDGFPLTRVERTPYQQMWVQWASLEDLCFHMVDRPELVNECFELLAGIQRRVFEAVRKAIDSGLPIPVADFPDNITAPAIGEANFRRWCVPMYNELAGMLAEKGTAVFVHMDGDLKPLRIAIGESKVTGLDSFSTPPDNDTSVADARRLWPEMRLWANFPSSVHLAEPHVIYQTAMRLISEAASSGRLQIQISENVPKDAWRKSYPQIVRAIRDSAEGA